MTCFEKNQFFYVIVLLRNMKNCIALSFIFTFGLIDLYQTELVSTCHRGECNQCEYFEKIVSTTLDESSVITGMWNKNTR